MLSMLSLAWNNNRVTMPVVCAALLLGLALTGSRVMAQSNRAEQVPWQQTPNSSGENPARVQPRYYRDHSVRQTTYSTERPVAAEPVEQEVIPVPDNYRRGISEQDIDSPVYGNPDELEAGGDCMGPGQACEGECDCDGCCSCIPCFSLLSDRLWFRGEYLMWWIKSANMPPLASTGVLGDTGTTILLGGDNIDYGMTPGGRFSLGYWLDPCQDRGIEAVYTFIGNKSVDFHDSSNGGPGDPTIVRPFYNVGTPQQDAYPVATLDNWSGTLDIGLSSELTSVEVLFRRGMYEECGRRLDFLIGYRYGRFDENLSINQSSTFINRDGIIPFGTVFQISDLFGAQNEFNGAELGFAAKTRHCRWSMELLAKLALGGTRSQVTINGSTVETEPTQAPLTTRGGILALPTNIGQTGVYDQNNFSVIPELGITVGYDVTCRLRATVGYTFIYWSKIARPGDQIDTNVNPSQFQNGQLVGVPTPEFRFITSDFWAQGLNLGLEYRF